MELSEVGRWFAGGRRPYMSLTCCMNYDWPWIAITIGLNLAVAAGYVLIAMHWWRNQRTLDVRNPAKIALGRLRSIFLLCGTCGYLFVVVKMFWPAWRLYDMVLVGLVVVTWKYSWGVRNLKVVYQELHRSQRLAADLEASQAESRRKSMFLSALSHDLRTPLNGLMLQAELAEIALGDGDGAEVRSALAEIRLAAFASSEMLQRFLEMGRLDWSRDPIHPSRFAAIDLAHHAARSLRAEAERKGLAVSVSGDENLRIRTDRNLLERILVNLVSNAIKFTDSGGVRIEVECREGAVCFAVEDSGIGIDPEVQGQLFDEFFQVQNRERDRDKGYGLGLAIALRLARRLGGDVTVDSVPGRGSRFVVALPDSPDDVGDGAVAVALAASPPPGRG